MKKLLLGLTAITLCVCLSACGNSQSDTTLTSLNNQLDETSNAISNVKTINPTDIAITQNMIESTATNDSLYNNSVNTQQSLLNEEYYKTDILAKTAQIKKCLAEKISLSKSQVSAVKELTNSLNKYTNSIVYSKSEMNNAVKSISSLKKDVEKNADKINAKLNRVACNSNARSSYYENLLKTLGEIENCLCLDNSQTEEVEENNTNQTENETQNTTKKGLTKNIDTYSNDIIKNEDETDENEQPENNQNCPCPNCPCPQNGTMIGNNNFYNRYNRFNPARNTDTYGPTYRNIDTYGGNGYYGNFGNNYYGNGMYGNGYGYGNMYGANGVNGMYPYNSNNFNRVATPLNYPPVAPVNAEKPVEQRIEDYEQLKEDNTLEKINDNENDINENKNKEVSSTENNKIKTFINKEEQKSFSKKVKENENKNSEINESSINKEEQNNLKIKSVSLIKEKPSKQTEKQKNNEKQSDLDRKIIAH